MNDLTLDYIPDTELYLYQRKDMFRLNTDTALLAHFMKVKKNDDVLDIGTNNGALLLNAALTSQGRLIGIDVQKEACELARLNCEYHHLSNCEIIHKDVKDFSCECVDVVVCNPPYFKLTNEKQLNINEYRSIARHEKYLSLPILCEKASACLKEGGRFYLVHRSDRLVELIVQLSKVNLEVKTIQMIRDQEKDVAHGVLIEAVKDGKSHCVVLAEHVITR